MTLTKEEIDQLFAFTESKLVHYYDLQVEIVDHLAAAIEEKMNGKNMTFKIALDEVYRDFGIFGFSHVVREKEKQIDRKNQKMLLREIRNLFAWPQLLFSMFLLTGLYTISGSIPMNILKIISFATSIIVFVLLVIRVRKRIKPIRKLRFLETSNLFAVVSLTCYWQYLVNFFSGTQLSYTVFTFAILILTLAYYRVDTRIQKKAMELYPEVFSVS